VTVRRDADWARVLRRVTAALGEHAIPAQAAGGLAARAWGGSRDLVDLDFYVPDDVLPEAARRLGRWLVRGPERVRTGLWDVSLVVLEVEGRCVELGGADTGRYRDVKAGAWRPADVDFPAGVRRTVLGVAVDVMPLEALLAYKSALRREVDLVDLHDLTGSGGPVDTRLAVYGTLAPGEINHAVVAGLRGTWTRGVVHGALHPVGWGMTHGFPALRWHPDQPAVEVQLLTSADLPGAWPRLDHFEGEAYRRIIVPVTSGDEQVLANIYVARGVA
jgi:gamma-glutamylcyclotransferase (GGCT)/AIG2-like uncharacterized protein YtfP